MQSPESKSPTRPFAARLKRSSAMILSMSIASILLMGCAASTKRSQVGPEPLVTASCPELTPLNDPSFGATTIKLVEVSGIYRECRAAALAGAKPKDTP